MIAAAFFPMPPLTESGAGVLVDEPTYTPVLASEVRTVLPEPLGVMVRLWLLPLVEMVVPVIEIVLAPKSRVPTLVMVWALAESCPPRVKALIWRVPAEAWMIWVLLLEKVRPAPLPVRLS